MAVIHGVLVTSGQPRQRVDLGVGVPDIHAIGVEPRFDHFADQTAVNRINVAVDVNQTSRVDTSLNSPTGVEPLLWQMAKRGDFLSNTFTSILVSLLHQVLDKHPILIAGVEVAATTQQQGLV